MLLSALTTTTVLAGEITGNGQLKDVNGQSACAFSGQEDLQWYFDDGNTMPKPKGRTAVTPVMPSHGAR